MKIEPKKLINILCHELQVHISVAKHSLEDILFTKEIRDRSEKNILSALKHIESIEFTFENAWWYADRNHELSLIEGILPARQLQYILRKWFKLFANLADENGINFKIEEYNIPDSLLIPSDGRSIELVIYNLIDNAVKYSFPNTEIIFKCYASEDNKVIALQIINRGLTLSDEEIKHCTELFWRGKQASAVYPYGAGLGLATVSSILGIINGKFEINSEDNKTIATVLIPILKKEDN